jgi:hypothetical protein
MRNPPSIDLASVKIPLRAPRSDLSQFSAEELKDELLARGVTDFSKLEPWIRNALLVIIFAAVCVGYWGMKCHDGIWSGGVCNFINL